MDAFTEEYVSFDNAFIVMLTRICGYDHPRTIAMVALIFSTMAKLVVDIEDHRCMEEGVVWFKTGFPWLDGSAVY